MECNPPSAEKFRPLFVWLDAEGVADDLAADKRRLLLAEEWDARRQRLRDQFQFTQLGMGEIRAGVAGGLAFARNLNNGGDFAFLQDRRAHDLLDGVAALVFGDRHGFKHGRVRNHREMID